MSLILNNIDFNRNEINTFFKIKTKNNGYFNLKIIYEINYNNIYVDLEDHRIWDEFL